jgi:molybdopterin converting factor small subunit
MSTDHDRPVQIRLLLIARYAEIVGIESCDLALSASATVADALAEFRRQYPGAEVLPSRPLCARNHSQVGLEEEVRDGDELALLPPLAGG